jgi:SAM-dependent methyltransferase
VEVGSDFPCEAGVYDTVISMNTFEHIFDVKHVMEQIHRSLRSGGSLLAAVPFLCPIHGHPDDFFRPTPSWFFEMLGSVGFSEVEVRPLVWGHLSTGLACSGAPGPFKRTRMHIALLMDLLYDKARRILRRSNAPSPHVGLFALSFFVKAVK